MQAALPGQHSWRVFSSASSIDWAATLGLGSRNPTEHEITRAFKTKAMKVHPDTSGKDITEAEEAFKRLVLAKELAMESVKNSGETRTIRTPSKVREDGSHGPPRRDQAQNLAYMMDNKDRIFAGIQKARQQDADDIQSQVDKWEMRTSDRPKEQIESREYGSGYVEEVRVTSRCDAETNGVEVETVEIDVTSPEGTKQRLVREQWRIGGQIRSRVLHNTLEERTRVARLLYGGVGKLREDDRCDAEHYFGKSEVLKEEVLRACGINAGSAEHAGADPVNRW
jgi:hypothetical protein